jgi:hemerythrin-like domain-containing protein
MLPTQVLMNEHKAVLLALGILEKIEGALAAKNDAAAEHLAQLLDFLKVFVDLCHHGKEETYLFPELERRGVPREGGPIGVMLAEHEAGRVHVRGMSDALGRLQQGDGDAAKAICSISEAFRELLDGHILKENNVLFPMADRLIPADVADTMIGQFESIERERVGEGRHEAYHAMLNRLKDVYAVS